MHRTPDEHRTIAARLHDARRLLLELSVTEPGTSDVARAARDALKRIDRLRSAMDDRFSQDADAFKYSCRVYYPGAPVETDAPDTATDRTSR